MKTDLRRFFGIKNPFNEPLLDVVAYALTMLAQPESWLHRELFPNWHWENPQMAALARISDAVELNFWAKTKDGQKNRNRPKGFPRPESLGERRKSEEFYATDIDTVNRLLGI